VARSQTSQESRWVGRVLRDKWRIDGRIARGGMGTVFAATHKNNGSVAAIKILHAEFSRDPDIKSRFLQEGYAANQVNHAGVVRILDDDTTEEGLAYLVMELLQGELLEQRRIRKGGKLPLSEVHEIGDQLLDVLAAAHAKEIVHRDIKPDNIFLTKEGRLKVLDFGFAQMRSSFRNEQTATGFLLGTPGFMAPEQAIGNRPLIDAQTDLWAVGATLFLLLTGEPVHQGESAAEMLIAAANYPARSVASLEPTLPPALVAVVDRALAFEKADRWPDARSMQMALRLSRGAPAGPAPDRARWGRSIPDDGAFAFGADAEDSTMHDGIARLTTDRPPGGRDSEKTQAFVAPGADLESPLRAEDLFSPLVEHALAPPPPLAAALGGFGGAEPTMIMPPAVLARPPSSPAVGDAYPPVRAPMGSYVQGLPSPVELAAAPFPLPSASRGHAEPARSAGARALVLFLIGGVVMVVVILTGLVVIFGLD
jgi:serine/threonine-protein kinase